MGGVMEEWVMCKSCLYVMKKSGLKDRCPACGVPAKMFMPHTHRVSDRRRRLLALDIHPIMVHFTQAFATTLPILCAVSLVLGSHSFHNHILSTIVVLGLALPVVVALTLAAGIVDGKVRFRRVITPLLKTKLVLSGALLALSAGVAAVVAVSGPWDALGLGLILGLSLAAFVCSSVLGFIGARLVNAAFPG
jgi:hypothetical protein